MNTLLPIYNMLAGCRFRHTMLCVILHNQNVAAESECGFLWSWLEYFQVDPLQAFFYLQSTVSRKRDQRNLGFEKS